MKIIKDTVTSPKLKVKKNLELIQKENNLYWVNYYQYLSIEWIP